MSAKRSPESNGSATPCQPSSSVESSGYRDRSPDRELLPVTRSSLVARRLVRFRACSGHLNSVRRRKREMIPADKKDAMYWDKRRKNNEAAKRSREKRRFNDLLLESQLLTLSEENAQLRAQVLNLHYQTSLSIENSKAASPSAASPASVLASSLSLSSIPSHTPAFLPAGLWGTRGSSSAGLGLRQHETAMHQLDAKIPCFSSSSGVFNPLGHHSCITQQATVPIAGPCVLSHGVALGGGRSSEADVDSQLQVSSSDDVPIRADGPSKPLSSLPTFLPTFGTLRHVPTVSFPPHNWVPPHLNPSAVYNNLLPWRSSFLDTPAVYPGLPVHIQGRQGQGVGVEELIQRDYKSRFSSPPRGPYLPDMHCSPNGRKSFTE